MQDLTLYDILAIFRRRRGLFLLTFCALFLSSTYFALNWARYKAYATVEIEQPYVPSSITAVGSAEPADVMLGLADRRISQIQQKVTSNESLSKIIRKLNLYPDLAARVPANVLADIMRSKIKLQFISSVVANPAAIQKESIEQLSAIAFTVSFEYHDPALTKMALDEIVEQFIFEEANQRQSRSKETSAFLESELQSLEKSIKDQEEKIAAFKAQFGESGPSAMLFNQQASLTNTLNLQNIETQIATAQATISTLSGQLAGTDPYAPTVEDGKVLNSPMSQLKALQAQYASLSGRYGPEHPDVVKVREQISALQSQKPQAASALNHGADNPVYLQLSGQLSAAKAQLSSLTKQRDALKEQQSKYDRMVAENPQIEQQMSQLTLNLDNAKERYRNLQDKRLASEMKSKLESGKHSERLKVINPTSVPADTSPRRKLLLILGFAVSVIAGIVMVALVEVTRQSVRGSNHLAAIVGIAPLVTIPHIQRKTSGNANG